jgi:PAS domain S-box-containing protein
VISVACLSIACTLIYLARKRADLRLTWVFVCFPIFIVASGASHVMEIWTVWHPTYWLSGGIKAVTALASVPTAILLVKLLPVALRLPSPSALEAADAELARRAEHQRLEDAQHQMAALVESAEDAIIIKSLDGVIRSWNPAAEQLLEYRAEEIIGHPITRLLPDDRQDEESRILAKIRRGEPVAHFETVRRRKSGSLVDVSLTISPIRNRGGAIVGASKIMRNITDRKQYLEQLRSLNAELESRVLARTAELRERDVMIQEIHHRVKNNLQVISSLINMQVRITPDDAIQKALRQCQSRVSTMAQIHEMLYESRDYSRVAFWKYAKELAGRVLSASGLSPAGVTIVYRMDEVFLPVDQAIPCGLILNELISNALKHAFPGAVGRIEIELRRLQGGQIFMAVSDDGIGISPDFEPGRSNSIGVGLVMALIKQLDGTFEILRQNGTSVRITFPSGVSA